MTTAQGKETIALVLIHGVGEQRPMATLRGFVKDIFKQAGQSKPDRLQELFEVRRLNVKASESLVVVCRELYWAHHIESSAWFHVAKWLWRLAMTPAAELRKTARHLDEGLYTKTRSVMLLMLVPIAAIVLLAPDWLARLVKWGWPSWLLALLLGAAGLAWTFLNRQALDVIGDAARYLDNAPANIGARQAIRTECMRFLEELNNSPEYSRIIVIGHSLGSVIAYDALRLLWAKPRQHAMVQDSAADWKLLAWLHGGEKPEDERASSPQRALFERLLPADPSQRPPWKISDLVTVGSPLTHAPLLFAGSMKDFKQMKEQREFPTCPPQPDRQGFCGWLEAEDGRIHLHHAAAFAVVRWTNIFFPSDPIGGPLHAVFGPGVRDVELPDAPRGSWLDHVRYWTTGTAGGSHAFTDEIRRLIFETPAPRIGGSEGTVGRDQLEIVDIAEEVVIEYRSPSVSAGSGHLE